MCKLLLDTGPLYEDPARSGTNQPSVIWGSKISECL